MSHDWPRLVYEFGDKNQLCRSKPFLAQEIHAGSLGSEPLRYLLHTLKPDHWVSAHMHVKFTANIPWDDSKSTKFIALNKCSSRNDFIEVLYFCTFTH